MPSRIGTILTAAASILAGLATLAGCDGGTNTADAAGPTSQAAVLPAEVRFGLVPSEGGTDIVERFRPLTAFLEARLATPVRAYSASDYQGIITAMRNGQVDIAYLGPKSYVEAARVANAEALLMELSADGTPGYRAIIIAHAASEVTTLAGAKGLSFGFVAPNSTSGYLVPAIGVLRETGEHPRDFFGSIRYTGSHGSSMAAVAARDLDLAATNTLDMLAMARAGLIDTTAFRTLWTSELIPGSVIAARGDLAPEFKDAVRQALLAFNDEQEALDAMSRSGFITATDADYDIVRVMEQTKADLEAGSDDDD